MFKEFSLSPFEKKVLVKERERKGKVEEPFYINSLFFERDCSRVRRKELLLFSTSVSGKTTSRLLGGGGGGGQGPEGEKEKESDKTTQKRPGDANSSGKKEQVLSSRERKIRIRAKKYGRKWEVKGKQLPRFRKLDEREGSLRKR